VLRKDNLTLTPTQKRNPPPHPVNWRTLRLQTSRLKLAPYAKKNQIYIYWRYVVVGTNPRKKTSCISWTLEKKKQKFLSPLFAHWDMLGFCATLEIPFWASTLSLSLSLSLSHTHTHILFLSPHLRT